MLDDHATGGRLEEALEYYKRSKDFGVDRAAMHIRNVSDSSLFGSVVQTQHSCASDIGFR